jgi:GDP/UDP-N,N'-diacetylbacillosamine 2-epimerase (hydrolysing)
MSSTRARRLVAVLTGTRAEYGLLRPVLEALSRSSALDFALVATGMHLSEKHGMTIREIESDGFRPIIATMELPLNSGSGMARSVGSGICGVSSVLEELAPQFLLVLGDRTEALAGAVAAAYMNIPVAHVHGGDISMGGLDESVRHAITKLAHIHFAATEGAARRIARMGEDRWRIHLSGAPGLDAVLGESRLSRAELFSSLELPAMPSYALLVQHPVSTQPELAGDHFRATLTALRRAGLPVLAIYPNSDPGNFEIINIMASEASQSPEFSAFKSLPRSVYLSLVEHCAVLVGNSSSGMIESGVMRTPCVNVGIRQAGRERGRNVIDAEPTVSSVLAAINSALTPEFRLTQCDGWSPYGDGTAGAKIASVLEECRIDLDLIQKQLAY